MLKKFISVVLVGCLMFPQISLAISSDYASKIDAVVASMSFEKLQSIDKKIDRLYDDGVSLSEKNAMILSYLAKAIDAKLLDGTAFSKNEVAMVDMQIMQIQNNIVAGMSGQLDALIGELLQAYNVEEKGDFSMTLDMDIEETQVEGELNLDNYTAIVSGLDSQITTDMSAFISVDSYGENMTLDISAFIDYISKDGNIYLLLKDLNLDTNRGDELQDIVDTLKKIAVENGYISITDDESTQAIQLLESFAPNVVFEDMVKIFDQPLLRLHSKRGNKYILVPTKYACDQAKILSGKFDPFYNSNECSDGQYDDLLAEFIGPEAYVYMTIDTNTTLGIFATDGDMLMQGDIVFNNDHILSSNLDITENDNNMNFAYKLKSHISLTADIPDENLDFNIYMQLDNKNYITSGNMDMLVADGEDIFTMDMNIKSGIISGKVHMIEGETDMFDMTLSGIYGQDIFSMDGDFIIYDNPFEPQQNIQYVNEIIQGEECYENYYGGEKFICYIDQESSGDTITGEFSIVSDMKYSKNNLDIFMKILLADDQILKIEMKNRSQQNFKEIEIEHPKNIIPYEEIFPKNYDYLD